MIERWTDVVGYEGYYQISNFGNVMSLNYNHTGIPRLMKVGKCNNGYMRVTLHKDGKQSYGFIHQMVCAAFLPNWENKPCVNHINENKLDNRLCNLEWVTHKENCNYGTRNERTSRARTNTHCRKVSQFNLSGELIKEWPSATEVRRQLGYAVQMIYGVCDGTYKQGYGYIWRYAS